MLKKIMGLLFTTQSNIEKRETPQEKKEPEYDWQYLITPGHVIFARMNYLSFVGMRLLVLFILSLILCVFTIPIAMNLIAASTKPQQIQKSQRLDVYSDLIIQKSHEIKVNVTGKVTNASDLSYFVKDNLNSLNKLNKILIPCNSTNKILSPWVGSQNNNIDYPMCLSKQSEKNRPARVYMFAIVNQDGNYKNWMGVFFKTKSKWIYKNIQFNHFYHVGGYQSFNPTDIINTMKDDFVDLPILNKESENNDDE